MLEVLNTREKQVGRVINASELKMMQFVAIAQANLMIDKVLTNDRQSSHR